MAAAASMASRTASRSSMRAMSCSSGVNNGENGAPYYYSDHQPGLGGVLDTIGDFLDDLLSHGRLLDLGYGL
jgi:hypothetical protein